MYKKFLLDHYHCPVNFGTLKDYNFSIELINFACSDKIRFQAQIEHNIFKNIAFQGEGCIISQATASILSEHILNKDFMFIECITKSDMLGLTELDLGPTRLKCIMLSLEAILAGIKKFRDTKV